MIIQRDAEKSLEKTQYTLIKNTCSKLGIERQFCQSVKGNCKKPIDNNLHNGETMAISPLSLGTRHESISSPFLFIVVQEKKPKVKTKRNKSINIKKGKSNSSCTVGTVTYIKSQRYTQKSTVAYIWFLTSPQK